MNDKKSFVLYLSNYEAIKNMSFEEKGMLLEKIFCYQLDKEYKCENLSVNMAFNFIKSQLDINNEKYQNKVNANRNNGKLGGRPKNPIKPTGLIKNPKNLDNDNDNDNVNVNDNYNDNVNDIIITKKETKNKYGEYNNILLTQTEYNNLQKDYSNYLELITYLDEYIEMKGYKAKSHYLAIKKWVVDAVSKNQKQEVKSNNPFLDRLKDGRYDD